MSVGRCRGHAITRARHPDAVARIVHEPERSAASYGHGHITRPAPVVASHEPRERGISVVRRDGEDRRAAGEDDVRDLRIGSHRDGLADLDARAADGGSALAIRVELEAEPAALAFARRVEELV